MKSITINTLMLLIVCQPLFGQVDNNADSTINGVLRLHVFEDKTSFTVEQFAHMSADSIPLIENILLPEKYQQLASNIDMCAIFVNVDSTELLIASQGHGLMRNQYEAFLIISVDDDISYMLTHQSLIYTDYEHFRMDCGIGIGTDKDELIRKKGDVYKISREGYLQYSYISSQYLEEIKTLNISTELDDEDGDIYLIFSFKQDKISCFIWGFSI